MTSSPRLSRFRDLVTLRSRHSWTSWRQRVAKRRVAREQRRLDLALTLVQEAQGALLLAQQRQERLQYPLLATPPPSAPAFNPSPGLSMAPLLAFPQRVEQMPQPEQEPTEADRLLGLLPQPTLSPDSES